MNLFYFMVDFILNCVVGIILGFLGFVVSYMASFFNHGSSPEYKRDCNYLKWFLCERNLRLL